MAKLIKLSSYLCVGGKFPNHDLQALLQHNNGDQSWSLLLKDDDEIIALDDELVYYACDSETLLLSLYDWKLLRRVSPPCGSIRVDERDVSISNNLVDFRGRYVTVSGVRIEGSDENSIAVWELDQGKRLIKSPWVLWLCMPCNLLKDFFVKVEQTASVRAYQFEASFTGRLIGASLKGHPELGGLAYDTKLDVWSHVPESAFRIAVPPLVCFQPDFRAIP
ncbi:uncharacterized protein LOC112347367 [Selaginella moellendorffii]|uniref:uncharacterized protein LOC112347367 n=1 Tax=Selaginella moellendorffii TaxID=88036 RepID=UPI000D1C26B5|nr:uncharacterized protein LOC112347367 [Selaginella moellendorffii]|eukprot:XP_024533869.1 uncharacterized protein LOC112347367 [Selaginella moellendorffii]